MCGITGFFLSRNIADTEGLLLTMTQKLSHRGPDEGGLFLAPPVGVGNRRLSILDLAGGHQPVYNEDRSLVVVYNGEIYNYPALRRTLETKGHRFATTTDTEVLVHAYEEYGPEFVTHLRGMFAFALYDRKEKQLLLARDPFGIKPLVYAQLPQGFFFASELRALLALPFFPRKADVEALSLYAALNYIPAPFTGWQAARRLPPGHWLLVKQGKVVALRPYETPLTSPTPWCGTIAEAVEALRNTLEGSVNLHLLSDVPVGAFLSGGLDSSLVVAMAQRASPRPLQTFTVTFPDVPIYDESHYARMVAHHVGTRHEEIPLRAKEAQQALWDIVRHLDEPFGDSSLVNVALISRVARRHVKVVLSGDGGDELFAGYNKYQGLRLAQWLHPAAPIAKRLAHLPWPERRGTRLGERLRQARKLLRLIHREPFERYVRATLATEPQGLSALFSQVLSMPPHKRAHEVLASLWAEANARFPDDPINQWLWADAYFVLPFDMLHKVDTASMAQSLEVRVPFVDLEVATMAFRFPGEWKLKGMHRKWILEKVAAAYLPEEILKRPKGGFGIPLGEWMRRDLKDLFWEYLRPEALQGGLGNPEAVAQLWQEHQAQKRDRFWELWNVFVAEVWRKQWKPIF